MDRSEEFLTFNRIQITEFVYPNELIFPELNFPSSDKVLIWEKRKFPEESSKYSKESSNPKGESSR
ncbi:hypothetical protein KHM19_06500 [Leptospira borgpetersenii]|nr:hypothetical protein KHM09_12890 [Leptospira borgpetersenii]GIM21467.1 hypothetical protein KHM19_06500 [Leptospira borgpetersenii]GIM24724.1 hypothetical protein KHM25_06490 [Leptospira borgpetersenii]